jgi:hypothetical protein
MGDHVIGGRPLSIMDYVNDLRNGKMNVDTYKIAGGDNFSSDRVWLSQSKTSRTLNVELAHRFIQP